MKPFAPLLSFVLVAFGLGCASGGPAPPASIAAPPAVDGTGGALVLFHGGPENEQIRRLGELTDTYALRPRAAWTIASLGELCAVVDAPHRTTSEIQSLLDGKPGILLTQPVQRFHTLGDPPFDDPYYGLQESIRGIPLARILAHTRGEGVRVALVDTGVDISHPDLSGRVIEASNLAPAAAESFTADRHGTALAGVVAAVPNNGEGIVGLAPGAEILALKACWYEKEERDVAICDSYTLARALDAAISAGADLVNLSLTGPPDPLLSRLLDEARRRSIVVITAVDETRADGGFPANRPEVLAVRRAPPENGSALPVADGGDRGWLVAPGTDVLSTAPGGGYDFFNGSSYAAAYVTGVVALLRSQDPALGAGDLVARVRNAARAPAGPVASPILDPCRVLLPDPDPVCD